MLSCQVKLNLTLQEIELGSTLIGGSKDRRLEIEHSARRREPFAIVPVRLRDGSRTISAIATTGEVTETARGPEIKFKPIWCRLFEVYSTPKDKLTRVVCEFDFGKYMVDMNGVHPVDPERGLTTNGKGTDPKAVTAAEVALGKLLDQPRTSDLVFHLVAFIQRSF